MLAVRPGASIGEPRAEPTLRSGLGGGCREDEGRAGGALYGAVLYGGADGAKVGGGRVG